MLRAQQLGPSTWNDVTRLFVMVKTQDYYRGSQGDFLQVLPFAVLLHRIAIGHH